MQLIIFQYLANFQSRRKYTIFITKWFIAKLFPRVYISRSKQIQIAN